jgi:hypothetical protein
LRIIDASLKSHSLSGIILAKYHRLFTEAGDIVGPIMIVSTDHLSDVKSIVKQKG